MNPVASRMDMEKIAAQLERQKKEDLKIREGCSDIPAGVSGDWAVVKFTLDKSDFSLLDAMRDIRDTGRDRTALPGSYTRLNRNGHCVMSDTPAELADLRGLQFSARNRVLVHGLGLGIAVELCLLKKDVKLVKVIEISQDVINLVGPTLKKRWGKRLEIVRGDAFKFKPDGKYSVVWSDIWDTICSDNLPEMARLRKLWKGKAGWHGMWCERACRVMR